MRKQLIRYQSYVLRFWQEQDTGQKQGPWRFTIEEPIQGHRFGFRNLEELCAYLQLKLNDQ